MTAQSISERLDAAMMVLKTHDAMHLADGLDRLDEDALDAFVQQIAGIDFEEFARLRETPETGETANAKIEPALVVPRRPENEDAYRRAGAEAISRGEIAAFTVAGGQGTRLGWNGPKGTFPAACITGKPLFRMFAEQLNAIDAKYGITTSWYVMTSPLNDRDTRAFFEDNNWFGRPLDSILLFPQGVMPAMDDDGRIMLAEPGRIAVSPDGHGGSLRALDRSGALEHARSRGVRHLSYFQVDNPSVRTIDPLFVGLHLEHPESSVEMSSKMIPKANAAEKVGVFCRIDGRTQVIEYSDLPTGLAEETDDRGRLRFIAGSIAIHLLSVDFIQRLTRGDADSGLPFHRARKKVPYWDSDRGETRQPDAPNATKFEMFVFDALHFADRGLVYETDRVEEFAPIKNATGVDSAESSAMLQTERAARWFEANDVAVPRNAEGEVEGRIEISPATGLESCDLADVDLPKMEPGQDLVV